MIKWTIKYVDYNDNEVSEDFYFNLNKAELTDMQFKARGAYSQFIERLVNTRDTQKLGEEFKSLILNSYGEKSDDGRRFKKSQEFRDDFEQGPAYPVLYMELLSDADKAAKFVTGVLPKDLQGEAEIAIKKNRS